MVGGHQKLLVLKETYGVGKGMEPRVSYLLFFGDNGRTEPYDFIATAFILRTVHLSCKFLNLQELLIFLPSRALKFFCFQRPTPPNWSYN